MELLIGLIEGFVTGYFLSYIVAMVYCFVDMNVSQNGPKLKEEMKNYYIHMFVLNCMRPSGAEIYLWTTTWFWSRVVFSIVFMGVGWRYAMLACAADLVVRLVEREYKTAKYRKEIKKLFLEVYCCSPVDATEV